MWSHLFETALLQRSNTDDCSDQTHFSLKPLTNHSSIWQKETPTCSAIRASVKLNLDIDPANRKDRDRSPVSS